MFFFFLGLLSEILAESGAGVLVPHPTGSGGPPNLAPDSSSKVAMIGVEKGSCRPLLHLVAHRAYDIPRF
ncbi:hypothetical protein QJS04_geneDACA018021 [Acorus gramineus]|uniref:Secreted protein n=1 Tax=Acorus gramineus TaxID=55184 RepID=A0AAV9AAG2_ACOGR|nr:hypothetical protein QJS04_geneDACA018021 [Acorus gramineus]